MNRELTEADYEYVIKALNEAKVPEPLDPDYGALVWSVTRQDFVYPIDLTPEDRDWWREQLNVSRDIPEAGTDAMVQDVPTDSGEK